MANAMRKCATGKAGKTKRLKEKGANRGQSPAVNVKPLARSTGKMPGRPVSPRKDLTMSMMWKSSLTPPAAANPAPEPLRFESAAPANEYASRMSVVPAVVDHTHTSIGKGMVFKGTVTGNGSLFVDGEVLGSIYLPEHRVTVGPTGKVSDGLSVCITAREIVIFGKVRGSVSAADRVEICENGTLTGSVSAARISIADGAYFKGDIKLHAAQPKSTVSYERDDEQTKAYA